MDKTETKFPNRSAIMEFIAGAEEPLQFAEIAAGLNIDGPDLQKRLRRRLARLERRGRVLVNRSGRYALAARMDMVCGRVVGHTDGYGFITSEDQQGDVFLSPKQMHQVLHGDRVMLRVTGVDRRGRREGDLVEVLEHWNEKVVGRFHREGNTGFVVPDDHRISQDIVIPVAEDKEASEGQIVVATITQQPWKHRQTVGKIEEIIGSHMAPGMETEIAIRKHNLPHEWLAEVTEQAKKVSKKITKSDLQGREDMRGLPLVTIDGEDARDFDDAVYSEKCGKGWKLTVAIADVAHYVDSGSALDREAFTRGNSVYFPERVIPMLPEALSNGICSLNPEVDRFCLVCEIQFSERGEVIEYRFINAVIRSQARLTYTEVAAILVDSNQDVAQKYAPLVSHLQDLYALYKVLLKARQKRGAIEFEIPETQIVFDKEHKIERIEPRHRNDAHKIVEECMLAANVCAANLLSSYEQSGPFRVHESPGIEKLQALRLFLGRFGFRLNGKDKPKPKDYSKVVSSIVDTPERKRLIQVAMLRSLSQARYDIQSHGHFALGYESYTHFTSPIRRYPDLLVHRAIKQILTGKAKKPDLEETEQMHFKTEHCSMTERRADEASWDVIAWLKAEYMSNHIGEVYAGVITSVTSFGFFVELKNVYVDGLVHVSSFGNDYFRFEADKLRWIGERTRRIFQVGDDVKVKVMAVDIDEHKIDFALEQKAISAGKRRRKRKQ
ncbi:ribonuclease R [Pseudomonadota bacterium]